MIIKKIGTLLLVRLKLFKVISSLSPVMIILSFFLIYFQMHLKEEYVYQQPSLRTKLEDIRVHKPSLQLNYTPVIQGIKYIKIPGAIENQCLIITFPQKCQNFSQIKNVYETLSKSQYNAKNFILLSYKDLLNLQKFFDWYYDPQLNTHFSFGIIRVGINIDLEHLQSIDPKIEVKQTKNKASFNIYAPSIHPDLDYYQAVKQLLQLTLFSWVPCEQVQREPLRSIKNTVVRVGKFLKVKHDPRGFAEHVLCQFNSHIHHRPSAHEIMMKNGFQAGSVKFTVSVNSSKPEQVAVSFVKMLSLQEEHLHSARTFFYPMSRMEQLPIDAFIAPGLIFTLASIILLISRFIRYFEYIKLDLPLRFIAIVMVWVYEYELRGSITFTLLFSMSVFGYSILQQIKKRFMQSKGDMSVPETYLQYLLIPASGLVSIYFGLMCFSLSIVTMFTTGFMLLKPKRLLLRIIFKIIVSGIFFYTVCFLYQIKEFSFGKVYQSLDQMSFEFKIVFILMFSQLSL